jgi:tetratricopeptide (TPR) repeat protein
LDLGNRLFEERKWQIVSEQYTKHIQINSGNPETYWRLSQCYINLNLSDKYFITLKQGIQMQPSDPRLHFPLIIDLRIIDLRISGRNREAIISAENACQLLADNYTFQILKYLTVPTIYDD